MESKLLEELKVYLEENEKDKLLTILIQRAIDNVKLRRNYPDTWSEDDIDNDLEKYYYVIFDAVVYAYTKIGIEGHSSLSENGITRQWISESRLYLTVVPFVKVL
jgi:hypothetical protein